MRFMVTQWVIWCNAGRPRILEGPSPALDPMPRPHAPRVADRLGKPPRGGPAPLRASRGRCNEESAGGQGDERGDVEGVTQMVTLGVDLASQPKRTATCLVRWDRCSARVEALSMGATDSDLHELFGRADKIGIDVPFGWPVPFARAVAQYLASTVWPSAEVRELRFRRTDKVVREKLGRWPLSVSSDLIAVPAMRARCKASDDMLDALGGGSRRSSGSHRPLRSDSSR